MAYVARPGRPKPGRRGKRGPNGHCQTCNHLERVKIEILLARGASRRSIGKKFGIHPDALKRHWDGHVADDIREAISREGNAAAIAEMAMAKSVKPGIPLEVLVQDETIGLLENLKRVRAVLYKQFDAAAEAGDRAGVGLLSSRLHENLRMAATKTGELEQHAKISVTNIVASPSYLDLRAALLQALRPYPEATRAVSAAFRRVEERSGLTGQRVIEHAAA